MGNVGSSLNEHPALYTSNPERFRITEIIVSNSSSDPYITFTVSSNKVVAVSNTSDLLEFAQDSDTQEISFSQLLPKF
ncbi:1536_t:CDS:2, partial [Paraglomus occultum]